MPKRRHHSLNPAASVIEAFGGPIRVAQITGLTRSTVWRWTQPRERRVAGGTGGGGMIPSEHQQKLIDYAKANAIDFDPAAFFR